MKKNIFKFIRNFIPLYENNDFNAFDIDKNLKKYIYNNIILTSVVLAVDHYIKLMTLFTYKGLNFTLMDLITLPLTIIAGLGVGMCIHGLISKIEEKIHSV